MSGRFVAAIARRILQQFRHDRRTLALLFVAPVLILSLFYVLIRGGSSLPTLDVVNVDSGHVGSIVTSELQGSSTVTTVVTDESQARADLDGGRVAAYLFLPRDFSRDIILTRTVSAEVHLEGTQPSFSQPVLLATNQAIGGALQFLATSSGALTPALHLQVSYLHGGTNLDMLDYFGAAFIGFVVFFFVFVVTIVSFLRERSQGTLERLMASPLRRGDIVVGYMLGFAVVATVQAIEVLLFSLFVLHVHNEGSVALIVLVTSLMTLAAVNLGILLSMFARTEFQAVQFIPLAIVPQILLSGILVPVSSEPGWLQYVSNVLPLTYAVSGLRDIMLRGIGLGAGALQLDLAVLLAFVLALILGAAATLRREVA